MIKKIVGVTFGIGILLATAVPTFAQDSATNTDTGPGSVNNVKVKRTVKTRALTLQGSLVLNPVNVTSNTGGDQTIGNTKVFGDETGSGSGSATTGVALTNGVNTSFSDVTGCDVCGTGGTASNDQTGPGSVNNSEVNTRVKTTATTVQLGVVVNRINVSANTGGNQIIGNTKVTGAGSTGSATTNVAIDNEVNYSETNINTAPTP